jgi:2-polyprenyl-3-methyl-5-hydroxy-6-metoxy-1,4-benzoquinol methylase
VFTPIPPDTLVRITDAAHERNIYAHPNALARGIFWQRLAVGLRTLQAHAQRDSDVLDFGGGSGAFLPSLAAAFRHVTVLDRDLGDARRVAAHYALANVELQEVDVERAPPARCYGVVVAMDVLEHFLDPEVPRRHLDACLEPGGLLLVSLPTENWLYRLGRLIVRKQKPADHYHPAHALIRYYRDAGYTLLAHRYVPRLLGLAVPLFSIALFRAPARS